MFKKDNLIWLYLLGIVILFFVLFWVLKGVTKPGAYPLRKIDEKVSEVVDKKYSVDVNKQYYAVLKTNKGDIDIELFAKNAPNTVNNFISLANNKYYQNLKFHRYIPGLLLQGGSGNTKNDDINDDKYGGPGYVIDDEINWDSLDYSDEKRASLKKDGYSSTTVLKSRQLEQYSIAMANNSPNTNGSQFFIVVANSNDSRLDSLEGRHTVFAKVVGGFDILHNLEKEYKDYFGREVYPNNFVLNKVIITVKN